MHYLAVQRYSLSNFNSIKVQLEQVDEFAEGSLLEFQFHKGTIRTLDAYGVENPYSVISIP